MLKLICSLWIWLLLIQLVDTSKNSSRIDEISHETGDCKQQFFQKDLEGSNLFGRK